MVHPNYIVIEGLEGAGKSTAINVISTFFKNNGFETVNVREPGGTPLAEELRSLTKMAFNEEVDSTTDVLMMYASRNQLLNNVVLPFLKSGNVVISDRSFWSSYAYQTGGGTVPKELQDCLIEHVVSVKPGLVIYLDIDPELGLQRVDSRGARDKFEKKQIEFFNAARMSYLELSKKHNAVVVDASVSLEEVTNAITNALSAYMLDMAKS